MLYVTWAILRGYRLAVWALPWMWGKVARRSAVRRISAHIQNGLVRITPVANFASFVVCRILLPTRRTPATFLAADFSLAYDWSSPNLFVFCCSLCVSHPPRCFASSV